MEKRKRIDVEFHLPEAIVQYIQSFLTAKQAAQTTVLSKSWYSAWSTRPNLDFDQRHFEKRSDGNRKAKPQITYDGFSEFVEKTMQRYDQLKLKIESFKLCLQNSETDSHTLANELIAKAMKMGAIDLDFEYLSRTAAFALPYEVLGCENIIRLSVKGCKIALGAHEKVNCSRLESLSFCNVYIEGDVIWDIISSCPLIERLSLSGCSCLYKDESFDIVRSRNIELSPSVEFGKQNGRLVVGGPINPYEFSKLTRLLLKYVKIDTLFFRDFSSKFPFLKDLTLDQCLGEKKVQISSCTLECISILQIRMLRAKFDVPSLRKFLLSSSHLPSLTIETASREWESHISTMCTNVTTPWFHKLKKLLTKLRPSKISLSFYLSSIPEKKGFDHAGDIQCLPIPVVENLLMRNAPIDCSIWDGLFWSCRPKFITLKWFSISVLGVKTKNDFLEVLCRRLTQEVGGNCCIPNHNMFGPCDLEEENVELFDETIAEWRPLPWQMLLGASTGPKAEQKVRFQLRWAQQLTTSK